MLKGALVTKPAVSRRINTPLLLPEHRLIRRIRQLQNIGRPAIILVQIDDQGLTCRKVGQVEQLGESDEV